MAKKTRQTPDKRSRQKISLLFLTIGVMATSNVMAQDSSQPVSVNDCQAIQDAAQRLSCYDSLFKTSEPAPNSIGDSERISVTDVQEPVSLQSPNPSIMRSHDPLLPLAPKKLRLRLNQRKSPQSAKKWRKLMFSGIKNFGSHWKMGKFGNKSGL